MRLCFRAFAFFSVCLTWRAEAQTIIYESNVVVQTFAGSGFYGHVDGTGVETMFDVPFAIWPDANTNFFVSDFNNGVIRQITAAAVVTTFKTNGGTPARLQVAQNGDVWVIVNNVVRG